MSRSAWFALLALAIASPSAAQTTAPDSTLAASMAVLSAPSPPPEPAPPDFPRGKISGLMFGDAYYDASGNPSHVYTATGADLGKPNIDGVSPITRDLNGVQMRRVYFQLDNDLSVKYSTRFLLEADGQQLTSGGKVGVAVKQAYVQARSVLPRMDFFFGMLKTPLFANSEDFWAYRALEKTIVDFWGLVPSADFGLEAQGFADPGHHVGYSAMIGNGAGQKPETDRFKSWYLSVPVQLGGLRVEPGVVYQPVRVDLAKVRADTDSLGLNNDQATYKIFAGYELRRGAVGLELVDRVNHRFPTSATTEPRGLSAFARGVLTPTLAAVARFDYWMPDERSANRVDTELWIAGIDWQPTKDIHVMPNLEATQYVAKGTAIAPAFHDLQARVTFYYRFSRPQS